MEWAAFGSHWNYRPRSLSWGLLMTVEIAKGPCLGDSLGTDLGSSELTQGKLWRQPGPVTAEMYSHRGFAVDGSGSDRAEHVWNAADLWKACPWELLLQR